MARRAKIPAKFRRAIAAGVSRAFLVGWWESESYGSRRARTEYCDLWIGFAEQLRTLSTRRPTEQRRIDELVQILRTARDTP